MSDDLVLVDHENLRSFAAALLEKSGVPADTALLTAGALVESNLRGVDSHGVQLLIFYHMQLEMGNMKPGARGHVVSENGGCLVYDGESGVGQRVADTCCDHAIRLAKDRGISIVVARDSSHFGAAAHWAQKMADAGCIGIVMCNASPIVAPWQGKDPRFGTNPICVALPGPRAWLLDMATTTVAMGWIFKAHLTGQPVIPAGWAMDKEGVPTTLTDTAMEGLLMPLGGYKGSGLGMMVEILCSVLSGGAMASEVNGLRSKGPMRISQFFLAIDIERFMPADEFSARMQKLRAVVKASAPAAGYDEVLVAGDPEWRSEEKRLVEGIPLPKGVWDGLREVANKLGVPIAPLKS